MKIERAVAGLTSDDVERLLRWHKEEEDSYLAAELYLIDNGNLPLGVGWECSIWDEKSNFE